jgi:fido (protein-threonine AMPylation protein)
MATDDNDYAKKFEALFYPGTRTLINRFDVRDPERLEVIERRLASFGAARLIKHPVKGNFDLAHMQEIHKKIFGGVYPWAGQVRDYPLLKRRPDGLVTEFARPNEITGLDRDLKAIMAETKNFTAVKPDEFAEKIARVYQIANDMHPFREGNGRTHRVFLDAVAAQAGRTLDFAKIDKEGWNYAASMSGTVNIGNGTRIEGRTDELTKVFKHIANQAAPQNTNPYTQGRNGEQAVGQVDVMKLADLNPKLAAEKRAAFRVK